MKQISIDDIHITDLPLGQFASLAYREERYNEIRSILHDAHGDCGLMLGLSQAVHKLNIPQPITVEIILSYLRYYAAFQEQEAERLEYAETEDLYDVEQADKIKEAWQQAALARKHAGRLRDLGVHPASIEWEPKKEKENQQEEKDYTIPFTVKGSITTSSSSYAAARQQISEILDNLHLDLRDKQEIRECTLDDLLLDGDD